MTQAYNRYCQYVLFNFTKGQGFDAPADYFRDALGEVKYPSYSIGASFCSEGTKELLQVFSDKEYDALEAILDEISTKLELSARHRDFLGADAFAKIHLDAIPLSYGFFGSTDQVRAAFAEKLSKLFHFMYFTALVLTFDDLFRDWYRNASEQGKVTYLGNATIVSTNVRWKWNSRDADVTLVVQASDTGQRYELSQVVGDFVAVSASTFSPRSSVALVRRNSSGTIFAFPPRSFEYFNEIFEYYRMHPT